MIPAKMKSAAVRASVCVRRIKSRQATVPTAPRTRSSPIAILFFRSGEIRIRFSLGLPKLPIGFEKPFELMDQEAGHFRAHGLKRHLGPHGGFPFPRARAKSRNN